MAQRAIREIDAKQLISTHWNEYFGKRFSFNFQSESFSSAQEFLKLSLSESGKLVIKPDMLFGERGKNNLVCISDDSKVISEWINEKTAQQITLNSGAEGQLNFFIAEPFVPHEQSEEYYISASTTADGDILNMSAKGGVDIMTDWDHVTSITIPLTSSDDDIQALITQHVPAGISDKLAFAEFAYYFYSFFKDFHFTDLEFNPFIIQGNQIFILDTVAKLDDTALFLMSPKWGDIEFPTSFGLNELTHEEKEISKLDSESGASLKLTVLNPKGRVWTLVAGGGASVVYADTISEAFGIQDMATYGEYSGNPTQAETFTYARTVIDLMTRDQDSQGRSKILLIGGAIANFTDVAKTFAGIIQAFEDMAEQMKRVGVKIYVRRGGPNYETGLRNIMQSAKRLGLSIDVYGPETHLTEIIRLSREEN